MTQRFLCSITHLVGVRSKNKTKGVYYIELGVCMLAGCMLCFQMEIYNMFYTLNWEVLCSKIILGGMNQLAKSPAVTLSLKWY